MLGVGSNLRVFFIVNFIHHKGSKIQQKTRRMAIANGTCVIFCNEPKIMNILASPGYAPGTIAANRGKCHLDEKRIQCLSNASQHVPIYLQPYPSNSTRKFNKFAILAHFLHILAYPGYAHGTIAVNITWMERGFNAGQTHISIYPSIFNRLWAIARYWSEITYPLAYNASVGGVPIGIPGKSLVLRKLESCG